MSDVQVLNGIKEHGVCAIVRGTSADSLCKIADSLLEGGVKTIEVTFNTPGAAQMIEELVKKYGKEMLIGAGTVLDSETARTAILSGASFILSPTLNIEMIRMCQRYSVLPVPGVSTPTEALTAWENGARIVKVFPAGVFGPNYIKQLKGPLPQIDMMAVGAINLENFADFIKAGASSAGIGGELVNKKLVDEGNFAEISRRARAFVNAFKEIKGV
ncbi:bifunctional 4-hydroxy-2-oxoglutarate aldolase/2-dehydro-3-deoxy-phosphogluconate aldolase [Fonticella tunisiensis]|uniref:2-dehydro-3-deoxyphosphogluconate aldolase/(4S)-4-hydroxy-2-oxoglutarate aldolase n=1 Tax=Fonticella tunisiensis TaxID=1096341 RepID=A0A4R7KVF9_9CLOT|nr:bifunctional 4-hydroxy-2-oxoglutarate aldolase/2-dehydro-3-deoxy-phosphogluconate aldolase [Fonticella tunisiensis]TDT63612.1 2-dehydro-3-deoxyphosphogluconate aldolase/(4S)-4-hydroxy-2-oxoglutarate aldolase [Fonticella tunisiensis]